MELFRSRERRSEKSDKKSSTITGTLYVNENQVTSAHRADGADADGLESRAE